MGQDYLNNKRESRRLAQRINDYWAKQGVPWVRAWVDTEEYAGKSKSYPHEIFVVRSNLMVVEETPARYVLARAPKEA